MTPEFSKSVDGVFTCVIDLLDRIERGQDQDYHTEQQRVKASIDRAEVSLGSSNQDWLLAKYALVAWIDDILIEAPWKHAAIWKEKALERTMFKTQDAFTQFYSKAREAESRPNKDALEVFYVCVVLNFRGLYRDPDSGGMAMDYGLPPTVEEWVSKTAQAIKLAQGRPLILENPRQGAGAPPLLGRDEFLKRTVWTVISTAIALVLAVLIIFPLVTGPSAQKDDPAEQAAPETDSSTESTE